MIVALLKILTSKSALEGERKQVTVLFADLKVRLVWDGGVCRMLGLEFLAARSRLFQDGMGLGPVKASKARPRPTSRRREHVWRQRVRTPTRGRASRVHSDVYSPHWLQQS